MNEANSKKVFWGCFIALITTSLAFSTRVGLVNGPWSEQFGLDAVKAGELFGAGVWPFAISIILFSLVIDKIGYKVAMYISFFCYVIYGIFAFLAHGTEDNDSAYALLWWGSVILGLGNGTVEAFINPVIATIFSHEKTKRLNFLHAGWPGGLVLGGLIITLLGDWGSANWLVLIAVVLIPSIIFVIMLAGVSFPVNERVAGGTSYREMLAEFGAVGAFIASWLIVAQLGQVFAWGDATIWIVTAILTIAYGAYARSIGRPLMIVLVVVMIPLAITELGTDSWITGLMEEPLKESGWNPILVLVYTSAIMMILRFNVGPIVARTGPLGLLAISAILAIIGLYLLAGAHSLAVIFIAATIYGLGKTFFWPTMLGVVAEQCPKGGAMTLNSIAGIGMLSVGILGTPLIGYFQETTKLDAAAEANPEIIESITTEADYVLGTYLAIDPDALAAQPQEVQDTLNPVIEKSNQSSLKKITIFPIFMLIVYVGLIVYFKSRGGYKPVAIADH